MKSANFLGRREYKITTEIQNFVNKDENKPISRLFSSLSQKIWIWIANFYFLDTFNHRKNNTPQKIDENLTNPKKIEQGQKKRPT